MRRIMVMCLVGGIWSLAANATAQSILGETAFPHIYTWEKTVPYGCLFSVPAALDVPSTGLAFDETITVKGTLGRETLVRQRGWRVGCHEEDASVLLINFVVLDSQEDPIEFPPIATLRLPGMTDDATVRLSPFDVPFVFGFVGEFPIGDADSPGRSATFIIDTLLEEFSTESYNSEVILALDWWLNDEIVESTIPAYDSVVNQPQFAEPPLHGRYSGQWIVEGLERQGLVLQVGEAGDRNFLFVVMFTYLDGEPIWTAGNADFEPGVSEVEVTMQRFEGGEFFTEPLEYHMADGVTGQDLGTMSIRANSCNSISADVDFSPSGFGAAEFEFQRLIRIAGYDCDQRP